MMKQLLSIALCALLLSSCSAVIEQEYNPWNNNIIFQKLEGLWVIKKHEVEPAIWLDGQLTNDYTKSDPLFYASHYIQFTTDYYCTIYYDDGMEIEVDAQPFEMDNKVIVLNNARLNDYYEWGKLTESEARLIGTVKQDGTEYTHTLYLEKIDEAPF